MTFSLEKAKGMDRDERFQYLLGEVNNELIVGGNAWAFMLLYIQWLEDRIAKLEEEELPF